jgi:hypothetical protein
VKKFEKYSEELFAAHGSCSSGYPIVIIGQLTV